MSIAALIRDVRKEAGLSVRELAARVGVSPATISDAEQGGDVRLSTVAALSDGLGLPVERLLSSRPELATSSEVAETVARVFGFRARRLVVEAVVRDDEEGAPAPTVTRARVEGIRAISGRNALRNARGLAQLVVRGTPDAAGSVTGSGDELFRDGRFEHVFAGDAFARRGLAYERRATDDDRLLPPGLPWSGRPPLSAPFTAGTSVAVDLPVSELVLVVRFVGRPVPRRATAHVWADGLALAEQSADLSARVLRPWNHDLRRSPRDGTWRVVVRDPVFGLHHGLGWGAEEDPGDDPLPSSRTAGGEDGARTTPVVGGAALRRARESAGLSGRELAHALGVSPATVSGAERGQDVRRSVAVAALRALPGLEPRVLARGTNERPRRSRGVRAASRTEAWELQRDLLGVEASAERKTLVITAAGDAHAVCETVGLRRTRDVDSDLRVRYGSASATGRRLPTELREIEERLEAESDGAGLRARVVARRSGRLIHEITVPRGRAGRGVSYSRRLFTPRFFDPDAGGERDAAEFDGAAIVPFHPTRSLRLEVRFPRGTFPQRAWFGVHPRLMVDRPLPNADLGASLHDGDWRTTCDPRRRRLVLEADLPLVGFLYDVFWERPATS